MIDLVGQRLFALAAWLLPTAGVLLVILAALRVRFVAEVDELTRRDGGQYWKSLPWESRHRFLRRFAYVSWGFTVIIVLVLVYGAWAAYWGWYRPGR